MEGGIDGACACCDPADMAVARCENCKKLPPEAGAGILPVDGKIPMV